VGLKFLYDCLIFAPVIGCRLDNRISDSYAEVMSNLNSAKNAFRIFLFLFLGFGSVGCVHYRPIPTTSVEHGKRYNSICAFDVHYFKFEPRRNISIFASHKPVPLMWIHPIRSGGLSLEIELRSKSPLDVEWASNQVNLKIGQKTVTVDWSPYGKKHRKTIRERFPVGDYDVREISTSPWRWEVTKRNFFGGLFPTEDPQVVEFEPDIVVRPEPGTRKLQVDFDPEQFSDSQFFAYVSVDEKFNFVGEVEFTLPAIKVNGIELPSNTYTIDIGEMLSEQSLRCSFSTQRMKW
jgi:hypothetical protein